VLFDLGELQKISVYAPLFIIIFVWLIYKWGIEDEDRFIINLFRDKFSKYLIKKR